MAYDVVYAVPSSLWHFIYQQVFVAMRGFLKTVLPKGLIESIRTARLSVDRAVLSVAQRSRLLTGLYYLLSQDFSSEYVAVLKGRQAYYDSLKTIGATCALLRRNIHRLEKGLIMRPRRSVFAEGFINETVVFYSDAVRSAEWVEGEKKWATDVLDEYFSIVGASSTIDAARKIYMVARGELSEELQLPGEFPGSGTHYKPYPHQRLPELEVNFESLKQLFIRRRSVRWYDEKPVLYGLVEQAANAASFAPSACNRQPYRFLFCSDKDKTVSIAKCAGGTRGFAENLNSVIVVVGDLSAYPYEKDRHVIYIDGSLASMQLMLALETLGLSTCSINWPDVASSEKKLRKIVPLEDYERVIMLLAVGYADSSGGIPYSQKKQNELVLEDISL